MLNKLPLKATNKAQKPYRGAQPKRKLPRFGKVPVLYGICPKTAIEIPPPGLVILPAFITQNLLTIICTQTSNYYVQFTLHSLFPKLQLPYANEI